MFKINLLALHAFASPIVHPMNALQYNKVLKGHNGRLVTQFRLGLSPLRNELFTYNIIDNPFCPACGEQIENFKHFIFECTMYREHRSILLNSITALCDYVNQVYNIYFDSACQTVVAHLLTHGMNLPEDSECIARLNVNSAIFNLFSNYISKTCRFMKLL